MSEAERGKRRPPAYQRHAADSQVAPLWTCSLEQHGLIAVMHDVQWLSDDDSVPSDSAALAFLIRRPVEEVSRVLPSVVRFFDGSVSGQLFDPPLRAYKAKLRTRSEELSSHGQEGNKEKQRLKEERERLLQGERSGERLGDGNGERLGDPSGERPLNSTQPNTSTQSVGMSESRPDVDDPFVEDMKRAESLLNMAPAIPIGKRVRA